jgi:hypothetical protein
MPHLSETFLEFVPERPRIAEPRENTLEEPRVFSMRRNAAAIIWGALCAVLVPSKAAAAQTTCDLTFRSDSIGAHWARELEAVREDLAERADVDHCASLLLVGTTDGARVVVTLVDGRSTVRRVANPVDLRATVTALVLVPTPPEVGSPPAVGPASSDSPAAAPPTQHPDAPSAARLDAAARDTGPHPPLATRRARLDLAATGGARWSGRSPGGAVGALAEMASGPWVVGVTGQWDSYAISRASSTSAGFTAQGFEIGAEAGHVFRLGRTSLTLVGGPSFVELSQKLETTPPPVYVAATNPKTGAPIGNVVGSGRDGRAMRLGGAARWTFVSALRFGLFVVLDANVDVTADSGNQVPAALAATSTLPTWGAGLSLGGTVSVWP